MFLKRISFMMVVRFRDRDFNNHLRVHFKQHTQMTTHLVLQHCNKYFDYFFFKLDFGKTKDLAKRGKNKFVINLRLKRQT